MLFFPFDLYTVFSLYCLTTPNVSLRVRQTNVNLLPTGVKLKKKKKDILKSISTAFLSDNDCIIERHPVDKKEHIFYWQHSNMSSKTVFAKSA